MKTLTGRHVLLMFVSGFGIIIAVNAALAVNAVRTFPGLEVPNSYIASQTFQTRLEAQQALGWTADATYRDGQLRLSITDAAGRPVPARDLRAHISRPTEARSDLDIDLASGAARIDLAEGIWRLDISAVAPDDTQFEKALLLEIAQ